MKACYELKRHYVMNLVSQSTNIFMQIISSAITILKCRSLYKTKSNSSIVNEPWIKTAISI